VEEYTEWQQSRVSNETFRDNIKKARDVTLENCLDFMQIYEDQDPGFCQAQRQSRFYPAVSFVTSALGETTQTSDLQR
jgi:hypothetical protein